MLVLVLWTNELWLPMIFSDLFDDDIADAEESGGSKANQETEGGDSLLSALRHRFRLTPYVAPSHSSLYKVDKM